MTRTIIGGYVPSRMGTHLDDPRAAALRRGAVDRAVEGVRETAAAAS